GQLAVAVTPKLVADRHVNPGTRFDGAIKRRIDAINVDVQPHAYAAAAERRQRPELRPFVAQHDDRVANLQLGVHDFAVRAFGDPSLLCAERLLVEFDGAHRVTNSKEWCESVISLRDRFYGHNVPPRQENSRPA